MELPDPPKNSRMRGPLLVFLASVSLVGGALAFKSSQDNQPILPRASTTPSIQCAPLDNVLGSASADVRASTQAVPWTVFNQQFVWTDLGISPIDAVGIPTGRALRFKIARAGRYAHEIGVSMLNARPVKAGEIVQARVWLKSDDATSAAEKPVQVEVRFQDNEPGFRGFHLVSIPVTNQFKEYTLKAIAPRDYCVGELNIALHLATGQHNIDIGPGQIVVSAASAP
jgi:hypothetical protein